MPRTPSRRAGPLRYGSPALAVCLLSLALAAARAGAQEPQAPGSRGELPTPDQLEPGVSTTPPPTASPVGTIGGERERSVRPAGAPAASEAAAAAAKGSTAAQGTSSVMGTSAAKAATATPGSAAAQPATAAKAKGGKGPSRLELDATEITGNRELPKVLYIVPWKRSDLGELVGRPVNSLLDEVLEPLDRDVFQRENRYYNGLKGATGAPQAPAAPGAETNP